MTVVETATRAAGIPAPAAPRTVEVVTVKRNIALAGRSYGHWWIELDDESYGWWPGRHPLTFRDVLAGGPGVLNGIGISPYGTTTRDPSHGLPADYEFHPVLVRCCPDDQLLADIRRFAQSFEGGWRWSTRPTLNCRLFQLAMFDAVGLVDGTGNYHTRGSGCPALAPLRRATTRFTRQRSWPRNLPRPGRRVGDLNA